MAQPHGRLIRTGSDRGVVAVLDLACEFGRPRAFGEIAYFNLAVLDLTAPPPAALATALAFIAEHTPRGVVYVHCKAGYSRTAAVAGADLLSPGHCTTAADAMARLHAARPGMVIRPEARRAIEAFAASCPTGQPPARAVERDDRDQQTDQHPHRADALQE